MTNVADLAKPTVAFIFGLATGLHCMGMCGPLSCFFLSGKKTPSWWLNVFLYHGTRILGYTLLGTLLGGVGETASAVIGPIPSKILTWVCILAFLCIAFRMDAWLPKPVFLSRWIGRLPIGKQSPTLSAFLIGAVTPIIPCGPLYTVLGVALISGSAWDGGTIMASFATGTVFLLLALQWNYFFISTLIPSGAAAWTRQTVALLTAGMLMWRVMAIDSFHPVAHNAAPAEYSCPFCHH